MIARAATTLESRLGWPPERFYWAFVPTPAIKGCGPVPPGLLPEIAEEMPLPIEGLHTVCAPCGGGLLVCALPVGELEAIEPGAVALHPERLPPGLDDDAAVAGNLNLLIGRFEPRAQRRRRVFSQLLSLAALAAVVVLLAIGLERRAFHFRSSAASAAAATDRLIASALPRGSKPGALAAEVARQQQAARSALNIAPAPDAAVALSALLKAWPSDAACKPQALTVNESGMTVSVLVEGDPAPFLREFRAPAGWSLEEPRLNTNREFTRIAIVLKPEKRSAP